jgi:hypothetical protein
MSMFSGFASPAENGLPGCGDNYLKYCIFYPGLSAGSAGSRTAAGALLLRGEWASGYTFR